MRELILNIALFISGLHLVIVLFLVLMGESFDVVPKYLWWLLLITIPVVVAGFLYYYDAKENPKYKFISHLEYEGILQPKFVFEYDTFTFYHEGVDEINMRTLNGYTTDSAAVADGVMVYRKVYPRIWGIFKHIPYNENEFVYTLKVTEAIKNATLTPAELNLKE